MNANNIIFLLVILASISTFFSTIGSFPLIKTKPWILIFLGSSLSLFSLFVNHVIDSIEKVKVMRDVFGDLSISSDINQILLIVVGGSLIAKAIDIKIDSEFNIAAGYNDRKIKYLEEEIDDLKEEIELINRSIFNKDEHKLNCINRMTDCKMELDELKDKQKYYRPFL